MPESPSLPEIVARLHALKAEHRPLVLKIAGDAGMDPATRVELLDHLMEEEEEWVARGLALAGTAAAPAPAGPTGLTVGSLRPRTDPAPAIRGTVGSLRRP